MVRTRIEMVSGGELSENQSRTVNAAFCCPGRVDCHPAGPRETTSWSGSSMLNAGKQVRRETEVLNLST